MNKKRASAAATAAAAVITAALAALAVIFGRGELTASQLSALKILLIVCGCSAAYCFTVGELTGNFSQMDKLWSLLPIAYVWITAAKGGMTPRLIAYAAIVTVWGVRLTVNFARKGAYSIKFWTGTEDYRWSIVRGSPVFRSRIAWTLFDLLFISVYQNALVLAMCLPAVACMEPSSAFGAWDIAAAVSALGFLALETVADEYQWRFHKKKNELMEEADFLCELPRPYDLGFNTTGPWSRMRHPNYLGEQGMWLSLYLFVIGAGAARHGIFHWTLAGPLLLILLFMGSSRLGERISMTKYPRYKDYIEQVYKYLPIRGFDRER